MMKCKPGNMVMAEAVPFGQRWTYHSADAMEAMLDPDYFRSMAPQLRAGDEIRLVRLEDERVAEIADVLVISQDIEFYTLREPTPIKAETPKTEEAPPKVRKLKVKKGYQCYQVVTDDEAQAVIAEYGRKKEAEDALPELERAA